MPFRLLFCFVFLLGRDCVLRQIGEFASDYIEVRRDYTDWTPPYNHSDADSNEPIAAGDRHARPDTNGWGHHRDNLRPQPEPNSPQANESSNEPTAIIHELEEKRD